MADVDAAALRTARAMGADVTVDVRTDPLPEDLELAFGIDDALTALQVAGDAGSGSSKVMLRVS